VNYIRLATTDDLQGPAVAVYALENGAKKIYILDSTDAYGKGIADAFEAEFIAGGGTVVGHEGQPPSETDFSAVAAAAKAAGADSIFYGGVTSDGAPLFRNALAQAGLGALPFYGGDGIYDGSGEGSYVATAGMNAENSYASQAAIENIPGKDAFNVKFKAEYSKDAEGYAFAGYACAQIIIEGIKAAVAGGTVTRETVRSAIIHPGTKYETVLGPVSFDDVGDTSQHIISLYKVEGGAWKFDKQIDYGN
jgi:branched-chain amino acid transport system substrate-binding protein